MTFIRGGRGTSVAAATTWTIYPAWKYGEMGRFDGATIMYIGPEAARRWHHIVWITPDGSTTVGTIPEQGLISVERLTEPLP